MPHLNFHQFDQMYQPIVDRVYAHWSVGMQEQIALHCPGWSAPKYDFGHYLRRSSYRYFLAYQAFARLLPQGTICDVGGFWGVFPLMLAKLGYQVSMTETLRYYGDAFNGLFETIRAGGVQIIDYDPFEPDRPLDRRFNLITLMAVLEHYPHSPRPLMENLTAMMETKGLLYLEVPNMAAWHKRVSLLRGHSPLPPLADVYQARVPFTGHHREYTRTDLRDLAHLAGLRILVEQSYDFGNHSGWLNRLLGQPLTTLAKTINANTREIISVLCTLENSPPSHTDPRS